MDDTKALIAALVDQGWRVELRRHYKAFAPDGRTIVVISATPSDRRALMNAISRLRRAGFVWPPPQGGANE